LGFFVGRFPRIGKVRGASFGCGWLPVCIERLLEPGEKKVRNPAIAMALRRIDMCEQAGRSFHSKPEKRRLTMSHANAWIMTSAPVDAEIGGIIHRTMRGE